MSRAASTVTALVALAVVLLAATCSGLSMRAASLVGAGDSHLCTPHVAPKSLAQARAELDGRVQAAWAVLNGREVDPSALQPAQSASLLQLADDGEADDAEPASDGDGDDDDDDDDSSSSTNDDDDDDDTPKDAGDQAAQGPEVVQAQLMTTVKATGLVADTTAPAAPTPAAVSGAIAATPTKDSADAPSCCGTKLCPYKRGICCPDGESCCPAGSQCTRAAPFVPSRCAFAPGSGCPCAQAPVAVKGKKCGCALEIVASFMEVGAEADLPGLKRLMDVDGTNSVSLDEFRQGLTHVNSEFATVKDHDAIEKAFREADKNADGVLQDGEIVLAAREKQLLKPLEEHVDRWAALAEKEKLQAEEAAQISPPPSSSSTATTTAAGSTPAAAQQSASTDGSSSHIKVQVHFDKKNGGRRQMTPEQAKERKELKEWRAKMHRAGIDAGKLKKPFCASVTSKGVLRTVVTEGVCDSAADKLKGTSATDLYPSDDDDGNSTSTAKELTDADRTDLKALKPSDFKAEVPFWAMDAPFGEGEDHATVPVCVSTANGWRTSLALKSSDCDGYGWTQQFVFHAFTSWFPGTVPYCVRESTSKRTAPRVEIARDTTLCANENWKQLFVFYAFH